MRHSKSSIMLTHGYSYVRLPRIHIHDLTPYVIAAKRLPHDEAFASALDSLFLLKFIENYYY